jgi:hypothetical protein
LLPSTFLVGKLSLGVGFIVMFVSQGKLYSFDLKIAICVLACTWLQSGGLDRGVNGC